MVALEMEQDCMESDAFDIDVHIGGIGGTFPTCAAKLYGRW